MRSAAALNLARNVKALMEEQGWSQRELARRSGVSQSSIGYALRYKDANDRHATLDTLEALAKAFGVEPTQLLLPGATVRVAPTLHVVSPRPPDARGVVASAPAGVDVVLLQMILEHVEPMRNLSADQRARLAAEAYIALAGSNKPPTRAAVLRLVRAAS